MKRIEVCEVIKCYHLIEVDDEVDVEELIQLANYESGRHESGSCGSVRAQLERLKDTYGFDYEIKLSYCGTEVDGISIVDEVD